MSLVLPSYRLAKFFLCCLLILKEQFKQDANKIPLMNKCLLLYNISYLFLIYSHILLGI